jgi:hypothetical protein
MVANDHYLQRTQVALILLAFLAITVPLSVMQVTPAVAPAVWRWVMVFYLFLLANTHFAITWALYLNSANLRHFASSSARKVVYFVAPAAILVASFVQGVFDVPAEGTLAATWFLVAVTAVDYFHAVRQSFGVLQMFKGRAGSARFSRAFVKADNAFFLSLWALQVLTFLNGADKDFDGRFDGSSLAAQIFVVVAGALLIIIASGFVRAWRSAPADRAALVTAMGYFAFQAASSMLVVCMSSPFPV